MCEPRPAGSGNPHESLLGLRAGSETQGYLAFLGCAALLRKEFDSQFTNLDLLNPDA